jgi:protein-L-isoaspartate(D-aspartate) O-methyltransferase
MQEIEYSRLRKEMVQLQIKARGIHSPDIIDAFMNVPRHVFVPAEYRSQSYEDNPLPIGFNQTISQPYIVAYMIEILKPDKDMRVLEIGTGSGYQTAILSCLCKEVYSLEIIDLLAEITKQKLEEEGYHNIKVKISDGYDGWTKFAPFDRIIVSCAPIDVPTALLDQLAEGGRMIIPVGESHRQKLYLIEKKNGIITQKETLSVSFVPMIKK